MSRYKMVIGYDGSSYAGWQVQPGQRTIQQTLEEGLAGLSGMPVKVHGSGRTDAGVHAAGQVAHVDLARIWQPVALLRALNTRLPSDIRVMDVQEASNNFHARKSAVGKAYRYYLYQGDILPPHERLYAAHVHHALDVAAMQRALARLIGQHDFAAFSANPDREVETTVRHLFAGTIRNEGVRLQVTVIGDGFLYKMVRSIVGWLIRVGKGDVQPEQTDEILASRIRTAAVPTAPPQGLFLWQVFYEANALASGLDEQPRDR